MSNEAAVAAEAPEPSVGEESPYIGGGDALADEALSPEEQAIYDQEMNEAADPSEAPPIPAAEADEIPVPDEPEVAPEITQEDVEEVEGLTEPEAPHETSEPAEAEAPAPTIPKSRLDREIEKRRQLEAQIAQLSAKKKVEEAVVADDTPIDLGNSIDAEAITKALDMNLDGKNSEAAAIIVEQLEGAVQAGVQAGRTQLRQELDAKVAQGVQSAVAQTGARSEQALFDEAVTNIETKYEVFNPDSANYEQTLLDSAGALMQAYTAQGMSQSEALTKAAENTIKLERPDLVVDSAQASSEPPPAPNKGTPAQRKANAAAATSQPPRDGGKTASGNESTIDLDSLSEEEYDALPESTLSQLRGDML